MNDQLLCGLALAAAGVAAAAAGILWLATAAFVASIPFVAVGVLLTIGQQPPLDEDPTSTL
jgi:hypothetical protein